MNRKNFWLKLFAFSLLLLTIPSLAAAQYRDDDDYDRNDRNRRRNNGGYNRNDRNRRDDDDFYRNNRRNNGNWNSDRRQLENAIRRVDRSSDNFADALDRALDRSRYDGSRREDRINDAAESFERSANNLSDSFDGGRNINRSADEARQLLQFGSQIDRFLSRNSRNLNPSIENRWSQIESDLYMIADAYNLNYNGGTFRNRRNDDYRDNRNNDRNNNRRNNGRWGNIQLPFPW